MSGPPVFLFCSGMRSGSTLLQRMIIGSGETMVWGETGGALDHLRAAWEGYVQMLGPGGQMFPGGLGGNGDAQRERFEASPQERPHLWIASMNPPREQVAHGFRAFFQGVYEPDTRRLGFARWGLKKVRSDLDTARFVRELFPEAKFVFLVREPTACLESIKQHAWMDRPGDPQALRYYVEQWRRIAGSFAAADFGYTVRYEDLVAQAQVRQELFAYLEIAGVPSEFLQRSRPKGKADARVTLGFLEKRTVLRRTANERRAFGY